MHSALSSRTVSAFPISIPTSLALESIFSPRQTPYDPNREIPQKIDISLYQNIWICLETLFRNLVNSLPKNTFLEISENEIADVLLTEIEVINSLFSNEGNNLCKPYYYHCSFKQLKKKSHRIVKFREDQTDGQKFYTYKASKAIEKILKQSDDFFSFDSTIKPLNRASSLILTHYPYDLLSFKNFNKLDLLESNTGKLKSRHLWNSKYYPVGDADLSKLPFTRKFLLVFGDRVLIQPSEMKLRKLIIEVANKRRWTPMTQDDKIMLDLELEIKEPYVFTVLNQL